MLVYTGLFVGGYIVACKTLNKNPLNSAKKTLKAIKKSIGGLL